MGTSQSWVAFHGRPAEDVRAELRLRVAGTPEEAEGSRFSGARLSSGWDLLVVGRDERFVGDALLARLSRGCEAVACFVESHVMVSQATGWRDGRNVWRVHHDSEIAVDHLEVTGEPPAELESIRRDAEAQQREDDGQVDTLFDVAPALAQALVGHHHDDDSGLIDDSFQALVEVPPASPRKSLWARLLGR
jgi:hypothetical protein